MVLVSDVLFSQLETVLSVNHRPFVNLFLLVPEFWLICAKMAQVATTSPDDMTPGGGLAFSFDNFVYKSYPYLI